ncbi:MAG: glycine--tRNA ligase subunit beta, partial [Chlamydiae bacterium]|nr:glycine--tRNA ligase subunit beta [Chlamydiota bacterium]
PSPKEIFNYYLQSLEAIGLRLSEHDIRFVHDDWEAPTQGASGVGWEVWCDGMEITQFTYFQTMAGFELEPISVELAYGVERLAMFLQNKKNIYEVAFNDKLSYGEIYLQGEKEWSRYNYEEANIAMLERHFNDFEQEALLLTGKSMPMPAYDYILKASHTFNMLEARGSISVTERTRYIHRIRHLSCEVAKAYVEERRKLGFPLLKHVKEESKQDTNSINYNFSYNPDKKEDCLIEIGSEDLPDSYITGAILSFERGIRNLLSQHQLSFEEIQTFSTPRRLTVLIKKLSEGSPDSIAQKKGPPVSIAFDQEGLPTKAAMGFFSSIGMPPLSLAAIEKGQAKDVSIRDGEYLYANIATKGESTIAILGKALESIISEIRFPKKMHWEGGLLYARPIRWITALFGKEVIPVKMGSITSSNVTYGHRQRSGKAIEIKHPKEYVEKLKKGYVIADTLERKIFINSQLTEIEKEYDCHALKRDVVLNQVVYLSEYPTLAIYEFDKKFLPLPPEVLMSEMVHHQRLFPCSDKSGRLSNHFIATLDRDPTQMILENNKAVLTARLSDGTFTYEQDIRFKLDDFNKRLENVIFQQALGSVYDKVQRIKKHAEILRHYFPSHVNETTLARAAEVCKADLASSMVSEFPELQGIIGNYYAVYHGESMDVAKAIEEHWMPTCENGALPSSSYGQILSIADKLDNIIGYYLIGIRPSSSKDPYALRRATLGILKILIEKKTSLPLSSIIEKLIHNFDKGLQAKHPHVANEIEQFFESRLKTALLEYDFEKQEIEATISEGCYDPFDQFCKVQALNQYRAQHKEFDLLKEVYKRAKGQTENQATKSFEERLLSLDEEKELYKELSFRKKAVAEALVNKAYIEVFDHFAKLQNPLSNFFEKVKVLDENQTLRNNRIALLQEVLALFQGFLDFSKL